MSEETSLSVEAVSTAAEAVAGASDFGAMAQRLLACIQGWAAPSVIVFLHKDPEAGWRTIPELVKGTITPAFERSIIRLVEDSQPGSLDKPMLVRPQDEVPGAQVKVRDNWIIPCRHQGVVGYLFLRGITPPYPENLGYAVQIASQPLWSHLGSARSAPPEEPAPAADAAQLAELNELTEKMQSLADRVMSGMRDERERISAESERRREARRQRDVDIENEAQELRQSVARLTEQASESEKQKAALVEEKDAAVREMESLKARISEVESLKARIVELERNANTARDEDAQAESEKLRQEAESIKEKAAALEKERAALAEEKETMAGEVASLKTRVQELEQRPAAEQTEGEKEALAEKTTAVEESRKALASAEARLKEMEQELEEAKQKISAAEEKASSSENARLASEAERDRAKAETHRLWGSIESLQKQLTAEKGQFDSSHGALKRERDLLKTALDTANERLSSAEARAIQIEERWKGASSSFHSTAEALRRTPFVPPMLRVAFSGAESVLAAQDPSFAPSTTPKPTHLLFLDREPQKLDQLATDLEGTGIEVLIAHYPEEISFFFKTSEARRVTGLVCDVMAFRGDQDIMEIMREWRQDLPSLALLVSFQAESAMETEKAQRLPVAMVAGYLPRPLEKQAVQDAVGMIVRRQFGRTTETPVPRSGHERQR